MYKKLIATAFAALVLSLGSANADVVQPQMKGVFLGQSSAEQDVAQPQMKFRIILDQSEKPKPQMKVGIFVDQSDDKQEVVQPQMKFFAIFCSPESDEDQAPKNMMNKILIL